MAQTVFKLLLIWAVLSASLALEYSDLYPSGIGAGDQSLVPGDTSKDVIEFHSAFKFFRRTFYRAYVDTNGIISLNQAFSGSNNVQTMPFVSNAPLVCPLWSDANTRYGGAVYYRLVNQSNDDNGLLMRARQEVMAYFIDSQNFVPHFLLIVTWKDIGYIWNSTLTNTFQAVLISDERESFVFFFYPVDGINWPSLEHPPNAIAGFNFGNGIRSFILPHTELTHDILEIEEESNVHSNGKWLFRVDLFRIEAPPYSQITATRIIIWPQDIEVHYGDLVSVNCTARGWPIPFVTYTKERSLMDDPRFTHRITPADSFTISAHMNLTYAEVTDTGDYTCLAVAAEATEGFNEDQKTFFIGVLDSPTIISIVTNDTFYSGSDNNLECVARGYPQPNVHWESDSISFNTGFGDSSYLLEPYTQNTLDGYTVVVSLLKLHPVFPDDHGIYTCIATNTEGEARAVVDITVYSPPDIRTMPTNTTLNKGDTYSFHCEVKGRPLPQIIWKKNSTTLSNYTTGIITEEMIDDSTILSTLTLVNITLSYIGIYECNAMNDVGEASHIFSVNVYARVAIISSTEETYTQNGTSVMLECTAYGNPPPEEIMWITTNSLYTDIELSMMTNNMSLDRFTVISTLTLPHSTLDSRGNFTCIAYNTINNVQYSDEETIVLIVLAKPVITSIDSLMNITQGTSIILTCTVVGYPTADTFWIKNNKETHNGFEMTNIVDDITTVTQLQLEVTIDDAGTYTCTANNSLGNTSADVDLIVRASPNITYISPTVTVIQNENLTAILECIVRGHPLPAITWIFNNEIINNNVEEYVDGNNVLSNISINNITLSHRGLYTCSATNSEGTSIATVELIVYASPLVTTDETEIMVTAGSNLTIMCYVTAFPEPHISWLLDENNRQNIFTTVETSLVEYTSFITWDTVTLDNSGIYTCMANNSFGTGEISIEVIVSAPPSVRIINDSREYTLICEALGFPLPSITWSSNTPANHSSDYFHAQSTVYEYKEKYLVISELILENITLDFRGNYTCQANNSFGTADDHVTVIVYAGPTIISLSNDTETIVYENITLMCTSLGYPRPEIVWLKNEEKLMFDNNSSSVQVNDYELNDITSVSSLIWTHIESTEEGVYSCTATNNIGTTVEYVELTVFEPPWITYITPEMAISLNDSIQLECTAVGKPTPEISWMHNGPREVNSSTILIEYSVHSILEIPFVQLDDMGVYICTANNAGGEDTAQTSIDVKTPPMIVSNVTEQDIMVGNTVSIYCTATGNPPPRIFWKFNEMNITNSTDERYFITMGIRYSILTIHKTIMDDFGDYTCIAVNEEGTYSQDFKLIVLTPPNLYLESSSCIAYGYPRPDIMWIDDTNGNVSNSSNIVIIEDLLDMFSVRSSLFVTNPLSNASGQLYHCRAVNGKGNVSLLDDVTSCSDDPVVPNVSVRFEELTYSIRESCSILLVCLVATTTERSFHIDIHLVEGTATAGEDFNGESLSVSFDSGKSPRQCVQISIMDDDIVEGVEYFTTVLETPYDYVNIGSESATVKIYPDDDSAKLYFERTFYSITEGEMISVCILMDPDIQKPILINVIPSSTNDFEFQPIDGDEKCFTISVTIDDYVEHREMITLHIYTNDSSIDNSSIATLVIFDYDENGLDAVLKYQYGYPEVHPLCVVGYFETSDDLQLQTCKLIVAGEQHSEQNCSNGYVAFYFEDYGEEREHILLIEGHLNEEQESFTLSTKFHLATITSCWVYLINDGITVYESSIMMEWRGTGAVNYRAEDFSYECRVDYEEAMPCSSPYDVTGLSKTQHQIQIRHVKNTHLCLYNPWQTYDVDMNAKTVY